MNFSEILKKVKTGLGTAGEVAVSTANTAGEKAKVVFDKSKHSLNLLDLKSECNALYKELGKLVYAAHKGEDDNAELVEEKIAEIDAKLCEIEEVREKIDELSNIKTCSCGAKNDKDAEYCKKCGEKIND